MTGLRHALKGRLRHRVVEPGLAAFAALLVISAAQAALPDRLHRMPLVDRAAATTAAKAPEAPKPVALVSFVQPVTGHPVISPFGLRQLPWENHGRLHEGVDIAAPSGLPIVASADGVVTRAGESPTYGRFVEIQHVEGLVSFYAHMGAIDPAIASGVAVKSGTRIGAIGNSGTSTGAHLHFELRDAEDRPLNPEAFLGKSFATAEALPITQAARVSGRVRLAYVSRIPESKRELMEAKLDKKKGKTAKSGKAKAGDEEPPFVSGSWMQARLDDRARVRAQIRVIAAGQHREDASAAKPAAPAAPAAPSAADAATPASAIVPLTVTAPPLELPG